MRIVNLKQFLALPNGTVFAKYEPCSFEVLMIKTANVGERDFCYQELGPDALDATDTADFVEKLHESEASGIELALDFHGGGRDGCFDDDQLFAVFSQGDVEQLIHRLIETKNQAARELDKQL